MDSRILGSPHGAIFLNKRLLCARALAHCLGIKIWPQLTVVGHTNTAHNSRGSNSILKLCGGLQIALIGIPGVCLTRIDNVGIKADILYT